MCNVHGHFIVILFLTVLSGHDQEMSEWSVNTAFWKFGNVSSRRGAQNF